MLLCGTHRQALGYWCGPGDKDGSCMPVSALEMEGKVDSSRTEAGLGGEGEGEASWAGMML